MHTTYPEESIKIEMPIYATFQQPQFLGEIRMERKWGVYLLHVSLCKWVLFGAFFNKQKLYE